MSNIPDFKTLAEAKKFLRDNFEEGVDCPCCKQFVKLYKRKLNSSQAYAALLFYNFSKNTDDEYIHVNNFSTTAFRGGEFAKLRYWQLIEAKENEDTMKKDSGYWKLTPRGIKFILGEIKIPKRVHLYDGQRVGWDDEQISILDALGDKFNYEELMLI